MRGTIIPVDGFLSGKIKQDGKLFGSIRAEGLLNGSIKTDEILSGSLTVSTEYDDYTGDYTVTPKIDPQTILVENLHMVQDVIVEGIPNYEVSNPQGGTTFIIA